MEILPLQSDALIPAVTDLGRGEAEVVGLGRENPGSLVILDDRLGRRVAEICGLNVTGSIGLLLKSKQAGHLAAFGPVLQTLRDAGLWQSDELVEMAIRKADET